MAPSQTCSLKLYMHRGMLLRSPPGLLQDLLDAVSSRCVRLEACILLLAPLLHLRLHVRAGLHVLGVPLIEGLPCLLLGVEDAEQVPHAEGIDRLRLVELVGTAPSILEAVLLDNPH